MLVAWKYLWWAKYGGDSIAARIIENNHGGGGVFNIAISRGSNKHQRWRGGVARHFS